VVPIGALGGVVVVPIGALGGVVVVPIGALEAVEYWFVIDGAKVDEGYCDVPDPA
jgi:hypothetical protein